MVDFDADSSLSHKDAYVSGGLTGFKIFFSLEHAKKYLQSKHALQ